MRNVKIVIPARYGSSRLPGKPLLDLHGKPVIAHVVERCIEAGFDISNIIVATDDERIKTALFGSSITVVMTSPNHTSGTDRINEVSESLEWDDEVIIINVQGDEPLIPADLIRRVAEFSISSPEFSITTAVTPITTKEDFLNPNVVKAILGVNGRALYFTRAAAPMCRDEDERIDLAMRHIGIYSYRVSALRDFCSFSEAPLEAYEKLEQLRALSNGLSIGATVFLGSIPHGIDTESDFENVKVIMDMHREELCQK